MADAPKQRVRPMNRPKLRRARGRGHAHARRTIDPMEKKHLMVSHAHAEQYFRSMGYPEEQIVDMPRHLPDPIDTERDAEALFRLGLSADTLVDRIGGSP
jgi:hypothetical protein